MINDGLDVVCVVLYLILFQINYCECDRVLQMCCLYQAEYLNPMPALQGVFVQGCSKLYDYRSLFDLDVGSFSHWRGHFMNKLVSGKFDIQVGSDFIDCSKNHLEVKI